jgi:hypothetical protein
VILLLLGRRSKPTQTIDQGPPSQQRPAQPPPTSQQYAVPVPPVASPPPDEVRAPEAVAEPLSTINEMDVKDGAKLCQQCGSALSEDSKFCRECGAPVS